MKFETLKQNRRKKLVIGLVVSIAVISTLSLMGTRAKYRTTESIKIVDGTIRNYSPADLNTLAIKVQNDSGEYDSSNTIPESGYTLNTTQSYCTIPDGSGGATTDTSIPMEYKDGKVYIGVNTKGTKCYLYFDISYCPSGASACETIMANMPTVTTRSSFSSKVTASSTGTIYKAEDDYGTSYYFAGNPTDNWVRFAGMYWRIIRINGDGTIRMIYQGAAANTTGTATRIGVGAYNSSYNNNMYVGYMYTSGELHGSGTSSNIKTVLDTWYNNNLSSYTSNIASDNGATFCNDRTPYSGSGIGTAETYYSPYDRLRIKKIPTFKCTNVNDRFSTNIGLITADEASYAGAVWGVANNSYYLYVGAEQRYWTMSPERFTDCGTVIRVEQNGAIDSNGVYWGDTGIRPVINLKANVTLTGSGTSTDPYVVS